MIEIDGTVSGGAGITLFGGADQRICELQRMYSPPLHGANRLYGKAGFRNLAAPLEGSNHPACDAYFLLDLPTDGNESLH